MNKDAWQTERLRRLATVTVSNVDKKSLPDEEPVRLCNYTDVYYNDAITDGLPLMEATATPEQIRRFGLQAGDVLITKDSETSEDIGVPAFVTESIDGALCGYHLAIVRARPGRLVPKYLFWALQSSGTRSQLCSCATGVTRFGLRSGSIRNLEFSVPTVELQHRIANFLDSEATRMDELARAKQRLAGLLHERLLAEIDRTTARGTPVRLRHLVCLITSGPRGWGDVVGLEGEPFIRSANLRRDSIRLRTDNLARVRADQTAEASRSQVRAGDVCVGITGANTGWVGIVGEGQAGGYVSQHVGLIRPELCSAEWLAFSLASRRIQGELAAYQYGGTKQQLGLEEIAELPMFLAAEAETEPSLVQSLLEAEARTQAAIRLLDRQIGLLKERRQALITAAVTGELDVSKGAA